LKQEYHEAERNFRIGFLFGGRQSIQVAELHPWSLLSQLGRLARIAELMRKPAKKRRLSKRQKFPPGWNEKRVRKVLKHYENQTEDEAVAEDAASKAGKAHSQK
jgi:hypothetical protein